MATSGRIDHFDEFSDQRFQFLRINIEARIHFHSKKRQPWWFRNDFSVRAHALKFHPTRFFRFRLKLWPIGDIFSRNSIVNPGRRAESFSRNFWGDSKTQKNNKNKLIWNGVILIHWFYFEIRFFSGGVYAINFFRVMTGVAWQFGAKFELGWRQRFWMIIKVDEKLREFNWNST